MCREQLNSRTATMLYITAGRGVITLNNVETNKHLTFKISRLKKHAEDKTTLPYFVNVLTGADNEGDFTFLGTFWYEARTGTFRWKHGARSKIGLQATSAKAFTWFLQHLQTDTLPDKLQVFHEGVCGKCGRKLTTPESIERGLGPVCAGET